MPLIDRKTADLMLTDWNAFESGLSDVQRQHLDSMFRFETDRAEAQRRFASVMQIAATTKNDVLDISRRFESFYMPAYAADQNVGMGKQEGFKDFHQFYGALTQRAQRSNTRRAVLESLGQAAQDSALLGGDEMADFAAWQKQWPEETAPTEGAFDLWQKIRQNIQKKLGPDGMAAAGRIVRAARRTTGVSDESDSWMNEARRNLIDIRAADPKKYEYVLAAMQMQGKTGPKDAGKGILQGMGERFGRGVGTIAEDSVNFAAVLGARAAEMGLTNADDPKALAERIRSGVDVDSDIRDLIEGVIDPVKSTREDFLKYVEDGVYLGAGSAPYMFSYAVPGGWAAIAGSLATDSYRTFRANGWEGPDAEFAALGSGLFQAGVERLSELATGVPWVASVLAKWGVKPGSSWATHMFMRAGIRGGVEVGEELIQTATTPAIQELAHEIGLNVPNTPEGKKLKDVMGRFFETDDLLPLIISVIPLGMLGASVSTRADQRIIDSVTRNNQLLRAIYSEEAAREIENATDPAQRLELLRKHWVATPTEEIVKRAQAIFNEEKAAVREAARALDEAERMGMIPVIRQDEKGQGWTVAQGDNVVRVATRAEAAQLAYSALNDFERRSAESTAQMAEEFFGRGEVVEISQTPESLADEESAGRVTPEHSQKRVELFGQMHGLSAGEARAEAVTVLGSNRIETIDGVRKAVSRIFGGGNLITVMHEGMHGRWRAALETGRRTHHEGVAWVRMAESASGAQFLPTTDDAAVTPEMLDEAIVETAVADIVGRRKDGSRFTPGLISRGLSNYALGQRAEAKAAGRYATWLKAWREFWGKVLGAAKKMQKARKEGKLSADFDAFLDDLLDLSSQDMHDAAASKEALDLAGDVPFSLGFLGNVSDSGSVRLKHGRLELMNHEDSGLGDGLGTFRYRADNRSVYWWSSPDEVSREAVEAALSRKGYDVARHAIITPANSDIAHGARAIPADASNAFEMPDGALLVGPTSFSIRAYHGTPHKVDLFSTQRIGTGEGTQAFGWGLYFAEDRKVAEGYLESLADYDLTIPEHAAWAYLEASDGDRSNAIARIKEHMRGEVWAPTNEQRAGMSQGLQMLESGAEIMPQEPRGNLYTVELLPNEDEFLDWDKPLSEQSEKVKEALAQFNITEENLVDEDFAFYIGSTEEAVDHQFPGSFLYKALGTASRDGREGAESSPEADTKAWLKLGIPGIKFLDGNSRAGGEGTRNYVIFDDKLVKILEENGRAVTVGGADDASFSLAPANSGSNFLSLLSDYATDPAAYEKAKVSFGDAEKLLRGAARVVEAPSADNGRASEEVGGQQEAAALSRFARDNGLMLDGEAIRGLIEADPIKEGLEHKVGVVRTKGRVIKDYSTSEGSPLFPRHRTIASLYDYLTDHILANIALGDDIQLEGFYEDGPDLHIVISQPFVPGVHPTPDVLTSKLAEKGVQRTGYSSFAFDGGEAGTLRLFDLHVENAIVHTVTGELIPIDVHFEFTSRGTRKRALKLLQDEEGSDAYSLAPRSLASVADTVLAAKMRKPEFRERLLGEARRRLADLRKDGGWRVDSLGRASFREGADTMASRIRSPRNIEAERKFRFRSRQRELTERGMAALSPETLLAYQHEVESLEDHPLVAAMLNDHGRLMSRTTAEKEGRLGTDGHGNAGDYDGAPWLPPRWYSKIGGLMPDQMAQRLHDAGFLVDAHADTLWEALRGVINGTRATNEAVRKAQESVRNVEAQAEQQARKEAEDWAKNEMAKIPSAKERQMMALRTLDAILSAFPYDIRGRVGGFVKLAGLGTDSAREKEISRRLDLLDEVLEKAARKHFAAAMAKLLKRVEPKRESGKKPKGKLGADIHALFDILKQAMDWTPERAEGHAAGLELAVASGNLSPEEEAHSKLEAAAVRLVADWHNADAARMEAAFFNLKEIWERTYAEQRAQQIATREKREAVRASLIKQTGKAGTGAERDARAMKDNGWGGWAEKNVLGLLNFEQLMKWAFGENSAVAQSLADWQRKAENQKEDAIQAKVEAIENLFTTLAGGRLKGEELRWKMGQKSIRAGGRYLSQLEAITALGIWQQADGRRHMEGFLDEAGKPVGAWHYGQDFIDQIHAALSPEAKAVYRFLSMNYGGEWSSLNAVFKRVNGVNLPQHLNYWTITVKPMQAGQSQITDPVTGIAVAAGTMTPPSLRTRSQKIAEPDFRDALQVYIAHTKQIEHWKANAELVVEGNAVLGNREVGNAVEAAASGQAIQAIRDWLAYLGEGGTREASAFLELSQTMGNMASRAATVAIVGRVGTLAIQSTQLAAAAAEMPFTSYAKRLTLLLTGNLGWGNAMRSAYIQRRIKQMPPIVQQAMEGLHGKKPNLIKHAVRRLGQLVAGADGLFTAGTFAIVYDYHLKQAREAGLSGDAAEAMAMEAAERITDRVAQPTRAGARSLFENRATGPSMRLAWSFASESRKNLGILLAAGHSGMTSARFARAVLYALVLNSGLAWIIRAAWQDARDGDDDELFDEKHWSLKRLGLTMATDWMQGIPVLGSMVQASAFRLSGEYIPEGNLFSSAERAVPALRRIFSEDPEDRTFKDTLRDVDLILSGLALGNETIAAAASLMHLIKDAGDVADNIFGE